MHLPNASLLGFFVKKVCTQDISIVLHVFNKKQKISSEKPTATNLIAWLNVQTMGPIKIRLIFFLGARGCLKKYQAAKIDRQSKHVSVLRADRIDTSKKIYRHYVFVSTEGTS